jgi:hypothetical protein
VASKTPATLGFTVRIGRAVVVALRGPWDAPEILGKTRIDVATTFEEGAVFHMAQELPLEQTRALVRESERRFTERARAALVDFTKGLGVKVKAAALVAPEPKVLPPIEAILKAHPLVHAAEGELYRRVFIEAGGAVGARPTRVPPDALAGKVGKAAGITPARVAARLAELGKTSGRPWAADHKRAALAAWLVLFSAGR